MATFDLRTLLNDLYFESVPAGGTQTNNVSTGQFFANPLDDNFLAKGAHTVTLASGDRVIADGSYALDAQNPDGNNGYGALDTFSFTLNINGVLGSTNGTTILLQNSRGTSANTITVGKDGVIGGDSGAIYAEAKTNVTNNGLITSLF